MPGHPTTERILTLDLLRGFALLGILLMNITSFALPLMAYFNPLAAGGLGIHRGVHAVLHIFADQKFMALFSLLFGASVMLFLERLKAKELPVKGLYFRRNGWLLVFGWLHLTLLWDGDILAIYALCAFALYLFHRRSPAFQCLLGALVFLSPVLAYVLGGTLLPALPQQDVQILQLYWQPPPEALQMERAHYLGGYRDQVLHRLGALEALRPPRSRALDLFFLALIMDIFFRAFGMMLMGMALYRWGVLTGQRSMRFYRQSLIAGMGLGLLLAGGGLFLNQMQNWQASFALFWGRLPNLLATPCLALAYIALIVLWERSELWSSLKARLAAVGRMALSNYILQSVLCAGLFYGFGLGWYQQLNRLSLLAVTVCIWCLQLYLSPLILRWFRFGPLEWLWRSLSYRRIQPLRK